MKKRILIFVYIIFFSFNVSALEAGDFIGLPSFSPFPDLAPFDATVTIVSNKAPEILDLDSQYYFCEGNKTEIYYNVSDTDLDSLTNDINPKNPFFVFPVSISGGNLKNQVKISSLTLDKSNVDGSIGYRDYQEIVSVSDGELSDSKEITITVIELNNKPIVDLIGVQTMVWRIGDNSTFYHQVQVSDVEDGNQDSGNLEFELKFLNSDPVFSIEENGSMFFDPNTSINFSEIELPFTYDLEVCVLDNGIFPTHSNIFSECSQTGDSIEVCELFSLTLTEENREPIIESYFPLELIFETSGTEKINFNISDRDPDTTIPDTYWFVDDVLIEYDGMSNFDEFSYSFNCGSFGNHTVKVEITDGLLNNSLEWNISLIESVCPPAITGSGGGGGGGGVAPRKCNEEWVCFDWKVCQHMSRSLSLLNEDDRSIITENCRLDLFDSCGFQIKDCFDVNACNSTLEEPNRVNHCYYVPNPSCSDGVKNCHDDSCELLVDCGGPCNACPTCSDSIRNQREIGVDCGGPCPNDCPKRPGLLNFLNVSIILIVLFIFIVFILFFRVWFTTRKIKRLNKSKVK